MSFDVEMNSFSVVSGEKLKHFQNIKSGESYRVECGKSFPRKSQSNVVNSINKCIESSKSRDKAFDSGIQSVVQYRKIPLSKVKDIEFLNLNTS